MASLTDYLESVTTQDTKKRLQAHAELVPFLSDPRSSLDCEDYDLDTLIEGLAAWVKSSNFKNLSRCAEVCDERMEEYSRCAEVCDERMEE
ncbi:clip-associating protein 1 [Plakobranchus ocellatus]|uniref:Clip-associating protein 1 n=1 Tax=Plakobranchus ocellatus TaxID=259542 RepID=A0AAV3ZJ71_9GAST|nr:clip-associating protein 1 [Plakobranchus ocellatus]